MAVRAGAAEDDLIVQADEITADGVDPEEEPPLGPGSPRVPEAVAGRASDAAANGWCDPAEAPPVFSAAGEAVRLAGIANRPAVQPDDTAFGFGDGGLGAVSLGIRGGTDRAGCHRARGCRGRARRPTGRSPRSAARPGSGPAGPPDVRGRLEDGLGRGEDLRPLACRKAGVEGLDLGGGGLLAIFLSTLRGHCRLGCNRPGAAQALGAVELVVGPAELAAPAVSSRAVCQASAISRARRRAGPPILWRASSSIRSTTRAGSPASRSPRTSAATRSARLSRAAARVSGGAPSRSARSRSSIAPARSSASPRRDARAIRSRASRPRSWTAWWWSATSGRLARARPRHSARPCGLFRLPQDTFANVPAWLTCRPDWPWGITLRHVTLGCDRRSIESLSRSHLSLVPNLVFSIRPD